VKQLEALESVKDRLMGRSVNGEPRVDPGSGPNDFDYSEDPKGVGCPFNAHIRRANPRTCHEIFARKGAGKPDASGDEKLTLRAPRILRRGNPAAKGDEVPRQFLKALSPAERQPFQQGSGRLELAQAIIAPGNPLTARVWANRVWAYHFGAGLVKTPSDFGLRAESPSHPELLDWLAQQLLTRGWSTKNLHREIVLSAAYQQASMPSPGDEAQLATMEAARLADPENRLLWRMNPRRLSFEEWRDTILQSSGELDLAIGGRAKELFPAHDKNVRRTLYGLVDRQFLNPAMRVFDFANPDLHIPQRSETTVSQQALFAMNHPFVAEQARSLVARVEAEAAGDPMKLAARLYHAAFQREPSESERQAAIDFLAAPSDAPSKTSNTETPVTSFLSAASAARTRVPASTVLSTTKAKSRFTAWKADRSSFGLVFVGLAFGSGTASI
jgi:hypothetical protein